MKKETIANFYSAYKLYIFPAVVVLSSLFLIGFIIVPQISKLVDNQKAVGQLSAKSKLLDSKVFALESYDEADLSKKVGITLSAFPVDKDYINILSLLQQLTAKSGFSIVSISFGEGGHKIDKVNSYTVKLQVKGSRILFQSLLSNLENSPRLVKVNSIDISSNQAAQELNAVLEIGVLYSQPPQNFGTEDSSLPEISQTDEDLLVSLSQAGEVLSQANEAVVGQEASPSAGITSFGMTSPKGKSNPFE